MHTQSHFLALHKGKFFCYKVGSSGGFTRKYDDTTLMLDNAIVVTELSELADIIARAMMETGIYDLSHSGSCDFPAKDGRPGFDRFHLNDMITAILGQEDA